MLDFGKSRLRTTTWYKRCCTQDRLLTTTWYRGLELCGYQDFRITLLCCNQESFFGYIPEKNFFRDLFEFQRFLSHINKCEQPSRREIVLGATREAKAVYSCTLQLPARVSPPSSAFSASSALKSQSNFLRMQQRQNATHH